jgi:hypothetical protein
MLVHVFLHSLGQLETFGSGAKIPRKQSPAGGREALPEGVVWLDFHSSTR